jgi:aminoglycoside 6'-N-acetyltransferase I
MHIEKITAAELEDWIVLRQQLWPWSEVEHRAEAEAALENPDAVAFLAKDEKGETIGFAEADLRRDYVNGCTTSPVGFLEGIYVKDLYRRRGAARALTQAVETWTRTQGCSELASDAWLDNATSHRMHGALGFEETERVVYFRKILK